ncbi:AAA family ATPase [Oxalobacteraceae bacterium OTU3CINTB1]|nr:AAA family ATPase [Oxalobacteraceae bacterium OTU3CINTB1]
MARIRTVEISNFRSIQSLSWLLSPGLNCLIGPGDAGKSTVLDAIDFAVGARRNLTFADTDFHGLQVANPIVISVTLGELPNSLMNVDAYGDFLRGYDLGSGKLEDEPRKSLETVLTVRLTVTSDLEPAWTLFSERASAQGLERGLAWKDRVAIAPARIGNNASINLSWAKGSVLNKLSEERPEMALELANAAREARAHVGDKASVQLAGTLATVTTTARNLGVPVGDGALAMLDAHAVSINDGAIALHNQAGIPLRSLGTGSTRLLIAGLQREAAESATTVLMDEIEYGLEPHRLMRLLDSLGAKSEPPPLQVVMSTHSPVALRELSGHQIFVTRKGPVAHQICVAGIGDDIQSLLRKDPEIFLAKSILVCEGASEVGLVRGYDQYWTELEAASMLANGWAYADVGGGDPERCYRRAKALLDLGYKVVVFIDADKAPVKELVDGFHAAGGSTFTWRASRALEDEIFLSCDDATINDLLNLALELEPDRVDVNIMSESGGKKDLGLVQAEYAFGGQKYSPETRAILGRAARKRKKGWFKSVTAYQHIAKVLLGPNHTRSEAGFQLKVNELYALTHAA